MKKLKAFFEKYFITGLLVVIPIRVTYHALSALSGVIDGIRKTSEAVQPDMTVEQGMKFSIFPGLIPVSHGGLLGLKQLQTGSAFPGGVVQ